MTQVEMLIKQVLALAWIRCVIEEGVDFKNKRTNKLERDEKVIYQALETSSGEFDVPAARGSKYGLEKNIHEVLGGFVLQGAPEILKLMLSNAFRTQITTKLGEITR